LLQGFDEALTSLFRIEDEESGAGMKSDTN